MGKAFQARQYGFALAANASVNLDVVGDYLKVYAATGAIRVTFPDTGIALDLLPGQGVKGLAFGRVVITDTSGASNTGTLILAYSGLDLSSQERQAEFIEDRLYGSVSVSNLGSSPQAIVDADNFFTVQGTVGAVAAQYANFQITNATANTFVISRVQVWGAGMTGDARVEFRERSNTTILTGGSSVAYSRLLSGATTNLAQVLSWLSDPTNLVNSTGPWSYGINGGLRLPQNGQLDLQLLSPSSGGIVLPAGKSIVFCPNQVNITVNVQVEFYRR